MSRTSIPSGPDPHQDLASWVDQVRQRNQAYTNPSSSSSSSPPSSSLPTPFPSSSPNTSPLESQALNVPQDQEYARQRQERLNRRSRLSGAGIRGISSGIEPTMDPIHTMNDDNDDGSLPPPTGRASSLLSRYGGQAGPTGVASGPKSPNESPVSLASFMGGKASGPRLGKLSGDGKSAPPELDLIHDGRRRLPGMGSDSPNAPGAAAGAKGLASFLEERAITTGNLSRPYSTFSANPALGQAAGLSTSPAKYQPASSRSQSQPQHQEQDPRPMPASPRKAYTDLLAGQPASSSPPKVSSRPSSPTKKTRTQPTVTAGGFANTLAASPIKTSLAQQSPASYSPPKSSSPSKAAAPWAGSGASYSPPKSAVSTSPTKSSTVASPWSTSKASAAPIPSRGLVRSNSYLSGSPRKDVATSPIKPEQLEFAKTIEPSATSTSSTTAKPSFGGRTSSYGPLSPRKVPSNPPSPLLDGPGGQESSSFGGNSTENSSNASAAFAQRHLERAPTASLTRLSAKKMVGQRIREAQERENASASASPTEVPSSPVTGTKLGIARFSGSGSSGIKDRWPGAGGSAVSASATSPVEERKPWAPNKFGNALPGLAKPGSSSSANRALGTDGGGSPNATHDEAIKAPVRLPGLGGADSPFATSIRPRSPQKEYGVDLDRPEEKDSEGTLESLTRNRARGPRRAAAAVGHAGTESSHVSSATTSDTPRNFEPALRSRSPIKQASSQPSPSSPTKSAASTKVETAAKPTAPERQTRGKRVTVLISGSGSNLQSLIDATLLRPPAGIPTLPNATINFVLSNRKAAFGLTRAAESNPPIPTKVLSMKTWMGKNPGSTREDYDLVLARSVLDGNDEGRSGPPDLIVLAGFMHIVSEGFLHALGHPTKLPASAPVIGKRPDHAIPIINLHPALPKAFDGANAIPRAYQAFQEGKVDKTGVMVHEVVADVDRGRPILVQEVPILKDWTVEQLEEEMHRIEHVLIVNGARTVLEGGTYWSDLEENRAFWGSDDKPAGPKDDFDEVLKKNVPALDALLQGEEPQRSVIRPASPSKGSSHTIKRSASPVKPQGKDPNEAVKLSVPISQLRPVSEAKKLADRFDVASLLSRFVQKREAAKSHFSKKRTISVEVVCFPSTSSSTPGQLLLTESQEYQILYSSEVHVVVHRYKNVSGLAETDLFLRIGSDLKLTDPGVMEKVEGMERRYGVKLSNPTGAEAFEIGWVLGGRLVTRRGERRRWDKDSVQMYSVRVEEDVEFVDMVEVKTSSLNSANSYLISVLSEQMIWNGKGSSDVQMQAVESVARDFDDSSSSASSRSRIQVFEEGKEGGLFWQVLESDQEFSDSWLHRYGRHLSPRDRSWMLYQVELQSSKSGGLELELVNEKHRMTTEELRTESDAKVRILKTNTDIFVLVGEKARGLRLEISTSTLLALKLAEEVQAIWKRSSSSTGIMPRLPVHLILLPSLLPKELRNLPLADSKEVEGKGRGRKMNLVEANKALEDLENITTYKRDQLRDRDHLPVGVDPAMVDRVV